MIQPKCKLRHQVVNQLFLIIAKCELLSVHISGPAASQASGEIKEIAFHLSEIMDSEECRAVVNCPGILDVDDTIH
jgi:hypothetical protein